MLDAHVLVLNRSWVAVNVTPVRRALALVFQGQARVVHPNDYALYDFQDWCALSQAREQFEANPRFIHTPAMQIRLPEVILLHAFNGFLRREVRFSRRNIFARDRMTCQYCGRKPFKQDLTVDHVIPRSRGGKDTWDNLVLACMQCNIKKANRTPEEARMNLLRSPSAPMWLPHFGVKIPKNELSSWQRFVDTVYWDSELQD